MRLISYNEFVYNDQNRNILINKKRFTVEWNTLKGHTMTTSFPDTLQSGLHTVEGANRMIPLLEVIGRDIIEVWDDIVQCQKTVQAAKEMDPRLFDTDLVNDMKEVKNQLTSRVEKINKCISEIEELNCVAYGLTKGIIMIPSMLENRKIFLCYRTGEDSIGYWCEPHEAYCQRKEIVIGQDFHWEK